MPAAMTDEPKPLTEEELAAFEESARQHTERVLEESGHRPAWAMGLVAEVRRLRALHYDQVLDDIGALLEALGKPNVARPESPQAVMRECIEEVRRQRQLVRDAHDAMAGVRGEWFRMVLERLKAEAERG
jgi:hypothetical protein